MTPPERRKDAAEEKPHAFETDGTARNRCVYNYPDGKQCRRGSSAKLHARAALSEDAKE
jgi:hypothetical protein